MLTEFLTALSNKLMTKQQCDTIQRCLTTTLGQELGSVHKKSIKILKTFNKKYPAVSEKSVFVVGYFWSNSVF